MYLTPQMGLAWTINNRLHLRYLRCSFQGLANIEADRGFVERWLGAG